MRDGARKWKGPVAMSASSSDRIVGMGVGLTTAGGVVTGHLAEVSMVLDCTQLSADSFGE